MREGRRTGVAALAASCIALCCTLPVTPVAAIPAAAAAAAARVEAHAAGMLAVGIVQGDVMSVHLSRELDNAPVRDAVLTVRLRGVTHPTLAEADGSYTLRTKDLELPGAAVLQFDVVVGGSRASLRGNLDEGGVGPTPREDNGIRQLGWWALNFSVCIGFLMLVSRRRKAARKN